MNAVGDFSFTKRRNFEVGPSRPKYCKREKGVVLVVGTHPCWKDDVREALFKYPDADLCAVNEAVRLVQAKHFASCHGEKIEMFMKAQADTWPDAKPPTLHLRDVPRCDTKRPCYRWKIKMASGSAPFAAITMLQIGYKLVIFCGCPMDGGGGYAQEVQNKTHRPTLEDPRIGYMGENDTPILHWKNALQHIKEAYPDMAAKIRSMSGTTQKVFGGIE